MKVTVITSLLGAFGFDEDGGIADKVLFRKNSKVIAEKLSFVDDGKMISETASLVEKLKKVGFTFFVFEQDQVAEAAAKKFGVKVGLAHPSPQGESLRRNVAEVALEVGFVKDLQQLRELTREVSLELTRLRMRKAGTRRDLMIAQAILSIDDLDKTINLFMGRIREWYGLHFPELDGVIEKHETYARLVSSLGKRLNFTLENLEKENMSRKKAAQVAKTARGQLGSELTEADIEQIQSLCRQTLGMYSSRKNLQEYASAAVEMVAPNVEALVGSLLAARLIALAGGLTNLAKMPASTIQVLGAEKALFRALKTGTKPPKHGIIYQDALVHDAKKWQRGKMSRALAGKLAIAARADAFSGRYIGDSLKTQLEKRVVEVKEKYPLFPSQREHGGKAAALRSKKRRKKRGRNR